MAGQDLEIGNDGDYIDDGAGGFRVTTSAQPALRHQVMDRLGEWVGDLDSGRTQKGIKGRQGTEREAEIEADSIRKALEKLKDAGLIDRIEVDVDLDQNGRFAYFTRTRDAQSGEVLGADLLSEFGGR